MTLNILRLPRLIAERRSTAILGMLIIGMLWAGIAFRHLNGLEADLQLHAIATLLTFIILAAMERMLRAEAAAQQKAEQLRLTLEHMNQGIMLVTPAQQIAIINRRCVELLDLPSQMIESPPRFDELTRYQAEVSGVAEGGLPSSQSVLEIAGPGQGLVCEYRPSNGKVIEMRSDCLPDGGILHTFADITKPPDAEAHIARLAAEDPLTGLPNRRVFSAALDQISGQRSSSRQNDEFAVLFLDLDRFKAVNDTLGHRIGDLLLQEVAKRLEWSLGSNSVLARLGGDEFAVIVPT